MGNYKPQVVTNSKSFGTKGGAVVRWNGDKTKLQVKIGDETVVLKAENVPGHSHFPSGEYFVQLSEDKEKITSIRPSTGLFVVKTDQFVAKEGEMPAPKTVEAEYEGKKYSYQAFYVILKILSPKEYEGMELFLSLRYHFESVVMDIKGNQHEVVAINHPKSKYTGMLIDYLDSNGVWEKGPIPWSANVLPAIAKRVALENKKFQVVVKDGWINTIFSMPDMVQDLESEVELEPETETDFEEDQPDTLEVGDDNEELPWE